MPSRLIWRSNQQVKGNTVPASRINDAREFLNSLIDAPIRLPFEPSLLSALFSSMSDNSRASFKELAEMVAGSQGLAAKVLSVANSACYGLMSSVTTLERAIQVLGILDLRALVVMFGMSGAVPQKDLPKGFPTRFLWEHQMRTAKIGRLVALILERHAPGSPGLPEPESVFAAGILHDIGKIILAYRRPLDWYNITNINNYRGLTIAGSEDEYWGIDHGTIGGIVLKDWNLPDSISYMVSWHHHPGLVQEHKMEVEILAASNILSECQLPPEEALTPEQAASPEKGLPAEFTNMLPAYSKLLGKYYADFVAVLKDSHTGNFINAV